MEVFDFYGVYSDCKGTVTAELTLQNYTLGSALTPTNFVSFHYDGSNLYPAFTVTPAELYPGYQALIGAIPSSLPSAADVFILFEFGPESFETGVTHQNYWILGGYFLIRALTESGPSVPQFLSPRPGG
ncbi:hypothetical protein [Rhodoblastus sp.]|uniref:hypothetical protein n=1 Tax=Rhodoblastus sp. TaxID=1962975 RepID=UPI003F97CFB5